MKQLRGRQAIGVISGVSEHNFSADVRAGMNLPKKVTVSDLTLREGRQLEGVILSTDEFIRIARQLEELGVPMIQTHYDLDHLRALSKLKPKMRVEVFSAGPGRPTFTMESSKESIKKVVDLGFEVIIPFALATPRLKAVAAMHKLKDKKIESLKKREIDLAVELIQFTKSLGGKMNVNMQDFMRCELDYLEVFCRALSAAGIGVIVLDDIAGPSLPSVYKYCTARAKKAAPKATFGIHVHNDFALGLPGVLGAFEAGAEVLECGINGFGERGGHADTAQLAIILEFLYGYDTGIHLEKLTETSRVIADVLRQPLLSSHPVVGANAFSDVSDAHWTFPDNPWITASLEPEVVGNKRRPIFGERFGPFGLRIKAKELGINIPDSKIGVVTQGLREQMRWAKRPLTDDEVKAAMERGLK